MLHLLPTKALITYMVKRYGSRTEDLLVVYSMLNWPIRFQIARMINPLIIPGMKVYFFICNHAHGTRKCHHIQEEYYDCWQAIVVLSWKLQLDLIRGRVNHYSCDNLSITTLAVGLAW